MVEESDLESETVKLRLIKTMDVPSLEHRRIKVTTNALSSSTNSTKLEHLAISRPFTQQLDIIFPSDDVLESALSKLETRYFRGRAKLSEIVDYAVPLANSVPSPNIPFTALAINEPTDDVWCIDPRGLLTLSLSKDTHQRLGLLGKKLPFKNQPDIRVVRIPLQQDAESVANRMRRNEALRAWDSRREDQGLGPWDVLFCFQDSTSAASMPQVTASQDVKCQITKITDVRIPVPSLTAYPSTSSDEDALGDWNTSIATLFEWVGMACFGSQRLLANDRVDPFVSVYECPEPSYVGNVTRMQWKGFIGPEFVQSVINIGLASVGTLSAGAAPTPFIAITSHALSASPVSYIPPSVWTGTTSLAEYPVRLPREDGEDTWCLLAVPEVVDSQPFRSWSLVESLGQYDAR